MYCVCSVYYCNVFRNYKQWTPINCAANHGHAKLIELLIDCGAPIDAKDCSLVKQPSYTACYPMHCNDHNTPCMSTEDVNVHSGRVTHLLVKSQARLCYNIYIALRMPAY